MSIVKRPLVSRLELPALSLDLPAQKYGVLKIVPVPFDQRLCNDGQFNTLRELMLFLARHCVYHHGAFNRNLLRLYLPCCRLLNLARSEYMPALYLAKKDLETEFHFASQSVVSVE
jgi:hypothetical protein